MSKVFIGVGHGGRDPGAVGNGLKEKDVNLEIALSMKKELSYRGVEVCISRITDEDSPVTRRITQANFFKPDLAIDIHTNAGKGDGTETFYSILNENSRKLGYHINNAMISLGQNTRGVKTWLDEKGRDKFAFVRDIKCPAVLFECAFIDNAKDITFIDSPVKRASIGVALAHAVVKMLNEMNPPKEDCQCSCQKC